MFEMTFADGKRRGMAFDSFSHAKNGSYLTKGGSMISRKDWPRFKGAFDDLATTNISPGELKQRSAEAGKERGAGSQDKEAAAADDGPDLEAFVALLRKAGLDEETVREALEIIGAGEAQDVLPHSALGGRLHGRTGSGSIRPDSDEEMERRYPGYGTVQLDTYGTLDPARNLPPRGDFDPARDPARDPVRRLPQGGTSRRVQAGDAGLAADEDIEQQIEREYRNVRMTVTALAPKKIDERAALREAVAAAAEARDGWRRPRTPLRPPNGLWRRTRQNWPEPQKRSRTPRPRTRNSWRRPSAPAARQQRGQRAKLARPRWKLRMISRTRVARLRRSRWT
jgi:hypothetical protein